MKRRDFTKYTGLFIASNFLPAPLFAQENIMGDWYGNLNAGITTLTLRLEILNNAANLYSISQNNAKIPASVFKINGENIYADFASIKAKFEGKLINGKIIGTFTQNMQFDLVLSRNANEKPPPPTPLTQAILDEACIKSGAPALIAISAAGVAPPKALVSGIRSVNNDVQAEIDDKWHLGSITKSFTALLIAILVEKNILKWDEPIAKTFGNYIDVPDAYKDITLLHLLSHRAGLQANLEVEKLLAYKNDKSPIMNQRKDYVTNVFAQTPAGEIGKTFLYSNSGFVIAGHIAELKIGRSWETLLKEFIFRPLNITSADFGAPRGRDIKDEPMGHYFDDSVNKRVAVEPQDIISDNPMVLGPAGTLNMNAQDMIKYLMARAARKNILSVQSWEKLETPPFGGNYALGVIKRDDGGIWHNGSNTLWYAEFIYYPEALKYAFVGCNYGNITKVQPKIGEILLSAIAAT
jgi:CubicO group peptidase (beta-lactamase class C family)